MLVGDFSNRYLIVFMMKTVFCVLLVVWGAVPLALSERLRPTIMCPLVQSAPEVDGRVDEAEWAGAARVASDLTVVGDRVARESTRVSVCRDQTYLYVAFKCYDSEIAGLETAIQARDGNVYNDDCVEVFIDSDRSRKHYYQFLVNPLGVLQDIKHAEWAQPDWNADCLVAAVIEDEFWSVELAIPLEQIDLGQIEEGRQVGINFTRTIPRLNEFSCWSPTGRESFHAPGRFGDMGFTTSAGLGFGFGPWSQDQRCVNVVVESDAPRPVRVAVVVESMEGTTSRSVHDIGADDFGRPLDLSYVLPPSWQDYTGQVEVVEQAGGALVGRSPRIELVGSTQAKLEKTRQRLKEMEADIHLLKAGASEVGYLVAGVSPFEPLHPTGLPPQGRANQAIRMKVCRGEYEPASCLIYSVKALQGVRVSLDSDLMSGDARLPVSQVDMRLVKWWFQGGGGLWLQPQGAWGRNGRVKRYRC